jgi:hypothetical protein
MDNNYGMIGSSDRIFSWLPMRVETGYDGGILNINGDDDDSTAPLFTLVKSSSSKLCILSFFKKVTLVLMLL